MHRKIDTKTKFFSDSWPTEKGETMRGEKLWEGRNYEKGETMRREKQWCFFANPTLVHAAGLEPETHAWLARQSGDLAIVPRPLRAPRTLYNLELLLTGWNRKRHEKGTKQLKNIRQNSRKNCILFLIAKDESADNGISWISSFFPRY